MLLIPSRLVSPRLALLLQVAVIGGAPACVADGGISGLGEIALLEEGAKTHFDHYVVHAGKSEQASLLAQEGFGLVWPLPPELAGGADDGWLA